MVKNNKIIKMAKKIKTKKYFLGGDIDMGAFAGDMLENPAGGFGAIGSLLKGDFNKKKKGGGMIDRYKNGGIIQHD